MKNLKTKKLYFQVYDEIKSHIIKNNLQPGDKLPTELELMATLGVSRNVLREAIKTLEIIGVLTSRPGIGMVINKFSAEFLSNSLFLNLIGDGKTLIKQSLQVRKVLEMGFVKATYDNISDESIKKLGEIVEKLQSYKTKTIDFYDEDSLFHKTLHEDVKNDILTAFIDAAWYCDSFNKIKLEQTEIDKTVEKHVKILDALKNKDYDAFYVAMENHFSSNYKKEKLE